MARSLPGIPHLNTTAPLLTDAIEDENAKLTDCYYDKKDWRACKDEVCKMSKLLSPLDRKLTGLRGRWRSSGPAGRRRGTMRGLTRRIRDTDTPLCNTTKLCTISRILGCIIRPDWNYILGSVGQLLTIQPPTPLPMPSERPSSCNLDGQTVENFWIYFIEPFTSPQHYLKDEIPRPPSDPPNAGGSPQHLSQRTVSPSIQY